MASVNTLPSNCSRFVALRSGKEAPRGAASARLLAGFPDAAPETASFFFCLPQIYREVGVVDPTSTLNHDQFVSLIKAIDAGLRALPATAQVC